MSELAVGIDLGTSNSCVAILRGGQVEVLANAYGENTTASVVAFHEDGMIEVGNRAKANIIHDPENTIYSAKRLIGRYFFSEEVKKAQAVCAYEIIEGPNHGVRVMAREEAFSLPEVSAMVLREMKQVAEAHIGEEVTKAVVTVPAYFNDNQRQATKDAGKIAGLEVLRILNEPTAAALAYGFGKELNQRVAVYDLGGGTFDVSVLEIGKDIFEVLSTCGDTFLGGDDFDDRLIDLLADEFVANEGINLRGDPYAFEKIKVAAENAKKTLSREEEVEIRIPDIIVGDDGVPRSVERVLTAEEYASLVQDLVMRTFKVCDEAMQQADLTTRDLDGVILVGGPTRLPLIRKAVSDYFQREVKDEVDPDEVVAKGAAIHAASLVNGDSADDAFLLDVTPLDLRIGVAGGLAEPVIEANTPVPIEQTRRFTTTRDFQESVQIRVYQGGARAAEQNEMLGQFEFAGFKKARRGDVAIDVTFEINADGIVNVTAFDPETEERASTSITLSSGLSMDELEEIIEQDKTGRVHTAADAADPLPGADSAEGAAPAMPATDAFGEPEDFSAAGEEALAMEAMGDLAAADDQLDAADDASPADDLDAGPALEVADDLGTMDDIALADDDLTSADDLALAGDDPAADDLAIASDDLAADDLAAAGEDIALASDDLAVDDLAVAGDALGEVDDLEIADEELDGLEVDADLAELDDIASVDTQLEASDDLAVAEADLAETAGMDAPSSEPESESESQSQSESVPPLAIDAPAAADEPLETEAFGAAESIDIELGELGDDDDDSAADDAIPGLMPSHSDLEIEDPDLAGASARMEPVQEIAAESDAPALELADADAQSDDLGLDGEASEDLVLDEPEDEIELDVAVGPDAAVSGPEEIELSEPAAEDLAETVMTPAREPGVEIEVADAPADADSSPEVAIELSDEAPRKRSQHPDDVYAPQIEIDPSQKEDLFDTGEIDLSAGSEDE